MASNIVDQSNHRIRLSDMIEEPKRMLPPIKGFEDLHLVSLEKCVESLISIVSEIAQMVYIVKQNSIDPKDQLSPDESASIMLYSMEWTTRDKSFYFILNQSLRSENRQLLKPWFLYLRLFVHSLSKLPSFVQTVYRGIKMDLSKDYPTGKRFVWWAFSSCTDAIGTLENEEFFGQTGTRTLFTIKSSTGINIQDHSMFPTENEVLLVAARQFQVLSHLNAGNDLHLIQIEEIQPPFPFISFSPSESPIPPIITPYQNQKIQDIIDKCQIGEQINLDQQNLTDQDMEIVVREAIINKQCRKVSLQNNEITSEGAFIIANAFNSNNKLEELMLFQNHLNDMGVKHLSNALSKNKFPLKTLGLGSNDITDDGIRHLARMIQTNQSLIVLGLVYNDITDQGVRLLVEAIYRNNTNLQILHLSKNKLITDISVNTFIEMFKRNHTLKELWIQNCSLSQKGKQKLKEFIGSKNNFRLEV